MVNVFDTMRVPGFKSRIFGRSLRLICGRRNIVITEALEKSLSNRSSLAKVARSLTPGGSGVALGELDHFRIVFDAVGAGAALGGHDDRAAVARTEIDQVIARRDVAQVEHLFDQLIGCRHPHHIFPRLTDAWLKPARRLSMSR